MPASEPKPSLESTESNSNARAYEAEEEQQRPDRVVKTHEGNEHTPKDRLSAGGASAEISHMQGSGGGPPDVEISRAATSERELRACKLPSDYER